MSQTQTNGFIYLVRHCATINDARGYPLLLGRETPQALSAIGKQQAARLAEYFASREIAAVYSSPASAAVQTARATRNSFECPLTFATSLAEANFGEWTGMTAEQTVRTAYHEKYYADPGKNGFPGGENFNQICRRAIKYIKQLADTHATDRIVVVSHDTVIRIVLCHLCGVPFDRAREIDQTPGCTNLLRIFRGNLELRSVNNDIGLLEEDQELCDTLLTTLVR
jgi:probable phosphoglycerate mutase